VWIVSFVGDIYFGDGGMGWGFSSRTGGGFKSMFVMGDWKSVL
jgi:hypothetical protein